MILKSKADYSENDREVRETFLLMRQKKRLMGQSVTLAHKEAQNGFGGFMFA